MRGITQSELMPSQLYRAQRREWFRRGIAATKLRRSFLGPFATVTFQSREMVWIQIQEALLAEPSANVEDELIAYNGLVPQGEELVFTLMFEIDGASERARVLSTLAGVEACVSLQLGSRTIPSAPLAGEEATNRVDRHGKTSAVHFRRFPLSRGDVVAGVGASIVCTHPCYGHSATLAPSLWEEVVRDLA